jgi:hypothetical protein
VVEGTPAPRRPPSLAEDLGVVGAVSLRRGWVAWALAGAVALTTPFWAATEVAVLWCAAVAIVLLRRPLLPRVALTGRGVAVTCVLAGIATAAIRSSEGWVAVVWAISGAGHAMILVWAVATAHALRRHVRGDDAERSSARLAIWAQEHPRGVVLALFALHGPCAALLVETFRAAVSSQQWSVDPEAAKVAGSSAGMCLLVAAMFQGRLFRLTEKVVPVVMLLAGAGFGLVLLAARGRFPMDAVVTSLFVRIGGVFVVLFAVEGGVRLAARRPASATATVATLVVALFARAAGAVTIQHHAVSVRGSDPFLPVLLHGIHDLPFALLLIVLAASAVSARRVLAIAVAFGVAEGLLIGATSEFTGLVGRPTPGFEEHTPWAVYAAIRALACVNEALFVLAARRVRSLTVVPPEHPLRADWAVDLGPAVSRSGSAARP